MAVVAPSSPPDQVPNTTGKKALAMEAYARALRQLPTIIADNGGYDGSELISSLRASHAKGFPVSNTHLAHLAFSALLLGWAGLGWVGLGCVDEHLVVFGD